MHKIFYGTKHDTFLIGTKIKFNNFIKTKNIFNSIINNFINEINITLISPLRF
jgi:hypothetical protein